MGVSQWWEVDRGGGQGPAVWAPSVLSWWAWACQGGPLRQAQVLTSGREEGCTPAHFGPVAQPVPWCWPA